MLMTIPRPRLTRLRLRPTPTHNHIQPHNPRPLSTSTSTSTLSTKKPANFVNIVEVGPRDGLQNEKAVIPPSVKVELINRLGRAGMKTIESGSFVSPKWVPQMAGTANVISQIERLPGVHYPVLIPNERGLDDLLALLSSSTTTPPPTDEIALFTASTNAFNLANTNRTTSSSLTHLAPVASRALQSNLRVRGYVSAVITCPYTGRVDPKNVRDVSRALLDMGCYEVSLGDTTGMGTPGSVIDMLSVVTGSVSVERLAGHFHDTYGTALSNIFASLTTGLRTFDSSIAGLGGCPFSPGATGNVATEDLIHALRDSGYDVHGDLDALVDTGFWISGVLGRENGSRAARALRGARAGAGAGAGAGKEGKEREGEGEGEVVRV